MQPLFTATPEGRKIKAQFQKKRLAESNEFIKNQSINQNDLKAVLKKYHEESKSAIEKARKIERLIDSDVVDPNPNDQWTLIHPPYFYCYGERYTERSGGDDDVFAHVEYSQNIDTGEFHNQSQLIIHNPGDLSIGLTSATSIFLIYFQMPATGRLNAWSYFECLRSVYSGHLWNEWGWSNAEAILQSRFFMMAGTGPDKDYAYFPLLYDYMSTSDDIYWSDYMTMPGEFKYCNFISEISYPAGQWVLLTVGINDLQDFVVDDMQPTAYMTNNWILRKLAISAVP